MSIVNMTLTELAQHLARRELSPAEVFEAYRSREDNAGAFITRCDGMSAPEKGLPLCGIPVAVKDNICTRGVRTTCASRMLEEYVPPYSATAWQRLADAGCTLLGKTNMDEFGMGSSTENSAFHVTRNPADESCVPGGSSGGSAAVVAAGLAPLALGSDTGGSIRQPAAFCGVVGMKPTYGRVSRHGLVAFASSLDVVGHMTRTVGDNALALQYLAGQDPMDATSAGQTVPDMAGRLGRGVKGLTIGLPSEMLCGGVAPAVRAAVLSAAETLEALGAHVEETTLPHARHALPAYYVLSSAEASSNLARFDGVRYGRRAARYADLDDMYLQSRSEGLGPEVKRRILLGTYALSAGYYDAFYRKAQQLRTLVISDFDKAFARFDALLAPVAPSAAWRIGEKATPMEQYMGDVHTVPASMAGIPALSLPWGMDERGLPVGLQLMGPAWSEPMLYCIGHALEVSAHG